MKIVSYCKATYVHYTFLSDELIFGKGKHSLHLSAKTTLRQSDTLISIFTGIQWVGLTYRDASDNTQKEAYVEAHQLSTYLGVDATTLTKLELQQKFMSTRYSKKRKWQKYTPQLTHAINAINLEPLGTKQIKPLCKLIEMQKYGWVESMCSSGLSILKVPKNPMQLFSIYLLKSDQPNEVKILINLGKKYQFDLPNLFRAVDYEKMEVIPFLKRASTGNPLENFLLDNDLHPGYALPNQNQVLSLHYDYGMSKSLELQNKLQKQIPEIVKTIKTFQLICTTIELNKARWISELNQNSADILKIPKSPYQKYSIYLVKEYQGPTIKIMINLGKKHLIGEGSYKIVTKAIDYQAMKVVALAKMKFGEACTPKSVKEASRCCSNELTVLRTLPKSKTLVKSRFSGVVNTAQYPKYYIFMKYCRLGDLHSYMDKLKDSDLQQVMSDLLEGLSIIHASGRVHQDLKTENILLYREKQTRKIRAKISDYGFCLPGENAKPKTGNLLYSSPAKLRGENHPENADVWALGMIFHNLIYGESIHIEAADEAWDGEEDRLILAEAYEAQFYRTLLQTTTKLEFLVASMIHPDPAIALTITQACTAFKTIPVNEFKKRTSKQESAFELERV